MQDFPGSPVVKTLLSNIGYASSIPGGGAKIPHASQKKKKKEMKHETEQYYTTFNKDFKNGPHQNKS